MLVSGSSITLLERDLRFLREWMEREGKTAWELLQLTWPLARRRYPTEVPDGAVRLAEILASQERVGAA